MPRTLPVVAVFTVVIGLGLTSVGASAAGPPTPAQWRTKGLQLGYNLDRAEALDAFRRATEAEPDSPANHRLLAAAIWTAILFDQGAVTVDDYLGNAGDAARRQPPDPVLSALFSASLDRAIALSEKAALARPADAEARYQVGAAYGLRAAYIATVDGKVSSSMGAARRAYREHQALIAQGGRRAAGDGVTEDAEKAAGLIVGLYRYTVSTLSGARRLGAYLAGFSGGKDEGLRLVEGAAARPGDARPQAQFTLVLLYNRERRYDDALRVIHELQTAFPKNRLLWLEEGNTLLRAGRFEAARGVLAAGLTRFRHDPRPKAPGEEGRWRYANALALAGLNDAQAARQELSAALPLAARDWVRGRIHFELGKLADRSAHRTQAVAEYREAERLCRLDHDTLCTDDARTFIRKRYRP